MFFRVKTAFFAAARLFRVNAALFPALRLFRVKAAFFAISLSSALVFAILIPRSPKFVRFIGIGNIVGFFQAFVAETEDNRGWLRRVDESFLNFGSVEKARVPFSLPLFSHSLSLPELFEALLHEAYCNPVNRAQDLVAGANAISASRTSIFATFAPSLIPAFATSA